MQALKMTSKRQVTFPLRVCKELGIKAGQTLFLEDKEIEGQHEWIIRLPKQQKATWYGSLHKYGHNKNHDMNSIRASIAKATKGKT